MCIYLYIRIQEEGGWTTMHLACRYGHHSLVRDLMTQYGMDPNEPKNVSPSIYSCRDLNQTASSK